MLLPDLIIASRYRLEKELAQGGMGAVWTAIDGVLERRVALKFVNPSYAASEPQALSILADEAKLGAKLLGHPNVVAVLDFGEATVSSTKHHFVVMEYVEGASWSAWISSKSAKLDPTTKYFIGLLFALEACAGIAYAHQEGVLHRDIKPLNIFVSKRGMCKVGDFGLARFIEAATRTHTVAHMKSIAYAAPEQWRAEKHTQESDLYQFGCTVYHALGGQLPFSEKSLYGMMNAHLSKTAVALNVVNPVISADIAQVVGKLLSKKSDDRASLWELHDSLATELNGTFKLKIDVSKQPQDVQEKAASITEFPLDKLKQDSYSYTFPDVKECLSEAVQLSFLGISAVLVEREQAKAP